MEILTPAEMYRADALAISRGISGDDLIDRAGFAVAAEIVRRYGARRTVVMCGPGNNGKDGHVVARYLKAWDWPVEVAHDVSGAELIVDALYGAGLNRDFPPDIAARVRDASVPVIAIDVPSGLDGLTGRPRGAVIKADLTVTFVRKKPAHVLYPGRGLCGEIVVADIGIGDAIVAEIAPALRENTAPRLPAPHAEMHKFKRGHAIVWTGAALNTGAARLAALAAARSGTGLVTLVGASDALAVHAAHVSSIMLRSVTKPDDVRALLADRRITGVCIGPAGGVNDVTRKAVLRILKADVATVLDADALTVWAESPLELFSAIKARPARAVVMTPHEGEFLRLFSSLTVSSQSKVERARAAAVQSGATILLKGPDTVIAHPDGRAAVNTNGSAKLAVAGSGDVLAGVITGLLAQGLEGFNAACAGAWLHAEAGGRCARPIAEDLIAAL